MVSIRQRGPDGKFHRVVEETDQSSPPNNQALAPLETTKLKLMTPEQFEALCDYLETLPKRKRFMYYKLNKLNPSWEKYLDIKLEDERQDRQRQSNRMYYQDIELFKSRFTHYQANDFQDRVLRQVFQALKQGYKNIFIIAPKRHGKTTIVLILLAYSICFNKNKAHKYLTAAKELAKEKIKPLARLLSDPNEDIAVEFGPFKVPDNAWTTDEITVLRSKNSPDPTLQAIGIDSKFTGKTSDILVIDDPCDSKMSRKEMQNAHDALVREAFATRVKDSVTIIITTRKVSFQNEFTDIAECFLSDACPFCTGNHTSTFKVFDFSRAILSGDYERQGQDTYELVKDSSGTITDILIHGDYEVRDPQRWPIRDLLMQYFDLGPAFFKCEFQNDISEIQSEVFTIEHRQYWDDWELDFTGAFLVLTIDAAYATSKGADYTGGVLFAVLPNRPQEYYILKDYEWKLTIDASEDMILEIAQEDTPDLIIIESIGQNVEEWAFWAEKQPYNIECIEWKRLGKADRILATVGTAWNRNQIWLCKKLPTLTAEMRMFPRGGGWHCLDALEQGIKLYREEYAGQGEGRGWV